MTYVMADIHGDLERFEAMLEQIALAPDDVLYILGDVVDRGPAGITILRKIMQSDNMKMLLGNHENMMLLAVGDTPEMADCDDLESVKPKEGGHWFRNGGDTTLEELRQCTLEERDAIYRFIRQLPLNIDVTVNGTRFKLVHASPIENFDETDEFCRFKTVKDFAIWERWNPVKPVPNDCVMIFGHSCTKYFHEAKPFAIWKSEDAIGIDCGCAYLGTDLRRLGCLRLEDMAEFYV